jgi:hypothetical protein
VGSGPSVINGAVDVSGRRIRTPRPRAHPHTEPPEARAAMPLLRTPAQTRANITARCTELASQRDDLDPAGSAFEAMTLQIDAALSALWALGPTDV